MYVRLCDTIGRPELIDDPRLCTNSVRIENRELIDGAIEAWTAERPAREAVAELRAAEVSVSLVHTAATLVEDEHVLAREAVIAVDDQRFGPLRMQGVVPRLTRTPGGVRRPAPAQGEHNREIYCGELGLDEAEFERLEADGVI
jgi:crotonobetainyl-CoA:carnitine CoA-transferase CaiB-like acyl-CoA transferase